MNISPSILSLDLQNFHAEVDPILEFVDAVHFDVMDGDFVPAKYFCDVKNVPRFEKCDVHFMVSAKNLNNFIEKFAGVSPRCVFFHAEILGENFLENAEIFAEKIKNIGATPAIAINPETSAESIFEILENGILDEVLVMTVNPGRGGQKFIPVCVKKVAEIHKKFPNVKISVDGGVNAENIEICENAGAKNAVIGSFLFAMSENERKMFLRDVKRKSGGEK